jgi:hypothetical protein
VHEDARVGEALGHPRDLFHGDAFLHQLQETV